MNDQLTITVTGPRGSGKTTLCECLARILEHQLGQRVEGEVARISSGVIEVAMHKSLPIRIVDTETP